MTRPSSAHARSSEQAQRSEPTRSRAICVYCGASSGNDPRHRKAAAEIGERIGAAGFRLIYGGGRVGLMGVVADAALSVGGKVTGIIPEHLNELEVGHGDLSELVVVKSMHQRKQLMFDRSDAFVVLPGGIGTLDETFEMVTWRQIGLHNKPVLLLNLDGYWQPFLNMVDHIIASGFARPSIRDLFTVLEEPEELLPRLAGLLAP